MNCFSYNQIPIGYVAGFSIEIKEQFHNMFCELSGDTNPLHINKSYALQQGFDGKVVYGMLTASFYSKLIGVYIPGEKCLLHSINVKFLKPVYINDCLKIKGIVKEKK